MKQPPLIEECSAALGEDAVARLDALARARGLSRTEMLAVVVSTGLEACEAMKAELDQRSAR